MICMLPLDRKFTHMTGIYISAPKGIYEQHIISAPGCQIYTNDTFVISTSKIDLSEIDCSIFHKIVQKAEKVSLKGQFEKQLN